MGEDQAGDVDCNIDFHSDLISPGSPTAAPTFAKFTAPTFSQESDTTRAWWRIWFLLSENTKLFLDVLTDKLASNY